MKNLLLILSLVLSMKSFAGFKHKENIVEVAAKAGNFNTLIAAAQAAGLAETLATTKNITVFAPTDEAFAKLPEGTVEFLLENPEVLKGILLYHVAGEKLKAKKVLKNREIKTLQGKTIAVSTRDGSAFLNDSKIIATDIKAKNGIIHVVDSVLLFDENTPNNTFETEQNVDLSRYLGKWYEIARYSNNFQNGCNGVTAEYGKKGRYITVKNTCILDNGKKRVGKALATVANKETNATLKVSFVPVLNLFGLFAGDYNIIKLGADYEYVLVGDRGRNTFWILARENTISDALYEELLDVAADKGFRKELIKKSPVFVD